MDEQLCMRYYYLVPKSDAAIAASLGGVKGKKLSAKVRRRYPDMDYWYFVGLDSIMKISEYKWIYCGWKPAPQVDDDVEMNVHDVGNMMDNLFENVVTAQDEYDELTDNADETE